MALFLVYLQLKKEDVLTSRASGNRLASVAQITTMTLRGRSGRSEVRQQN